MKQTTTKYHQITKEDSNRGGEARTKKKPKKNKALQNTQKTIKAMATVSPYLYFKCKWLNSPVRKYIVTKGI